jgi:hypothetical protein
MRRSLPFLLLALAACASQPPFSPHVIYVHGKAVEDGGRRPTTGYGVYEYDAILDALRAEGFEVTSEQRPKDADPNVYAEHVAAEVRALLGRGVPPSSITVIGASKGAVITMLASTRLQHPDVRYVVLGNCNDSIFRRFDIRLSGHVLSVFETADELGQTCAQFFERSGKLTSHDEIELRLGIGHAFLYTPRRDWLDPAARWARGLSPAR